MRGARSQSGVSMVEVLISALVVGLTFVAAGDALSECAVTQHDLAGEPIQAANIARELYEVALLLPTAASGKPVAKSAAQVVALDTLDGAALSPAVDAQLKSPAAFAGWKQTSDLQIYDAADLGKPLSETYLACNAWDGRVVKLSVTVSFLAADKGTWSWWINP